MTTKKLLAGVAFAALLAGAAQAQVASVVDAAATDNSLPPTDEAFIASEFQPAAAVDQLAGTIGIDLTMGANAAFNTIPVNGRVRMELSLTNATFTAASGAVFTNPTVAGTPCEFETAPIEGGGVGASSVVFISSANNPGFNGCINTQFGDLASAIRRTDSSLPVTATLTYTQVNADGSAVANPVQVSENFTFANLATAWNGLADTHAFTPGAELLATNAGILAAGTLGKVDIDFRLTAPNSVPAAVAIRNSAGADFAGAADLLGAANQLIVTFPNGIGDVTGIALEGGIGACAAPAGNSITCTLSEAEIDTIAGDPTGLDINYTVGGGGGAPVTPEQTVTAQLVVAPDTNYVVSGFNGDLADIKHDNGLRVDAVGGGAPNGSFSWVRFGSGGTESNFRIQMASAADAAGITQVQVDVAAGNGVSAGTVNLPLGTADTGFQVQGSTITFNSRALGHVSGETGNANINSISLQFQEAVLGAGGGAGNAGSDKVIAATVDRQLVNRNPGSFVAGAGLESDN